MQHEAENDPEQQQRKPRWQPLTAIDRRTAGVLVEKAKTTPENYPLSLNAVRVACNQKSNRFPQMHLDEEAVGQSLDCLRSLGAATEIQGAGRVPKYRHLLYEWLGVDKVEMAVMTELLLRGAQTVSELRSRASRMEPIADLAGLQPILDSLAAKGLIVYLTHQGRGRTVTHALYQPDEIDELHRQYDSQSGREPAGQYASPPAAPPRPQPAVAPDLKAEVQALRRDVDELRSELRELRLKFDSGIQGDDAHNDMGGIRRS